MPLTLSVALAGVGWVVVAATHYWLMLLYNVLWLGAVLAVLAVWVTALGLTVWAVWGTRRRHGARWAGVVAAAALVIAVTFAASFVSGGWTRMYATTQFWLYRGDFVAVSELVGAGELGTPGEDWDYYGADLPQRYRHLAANGKVAVVGEDREGRPVLFLPVLLGIPDGAAGFAHLPSEDALDAQLDLFGDVGRPRFFLGDGWWWVG